MANPREKRPVIHTKKHIARLERERRQTRLILFSFFGVLLVVVGLIVYGYLDIHYLQSLRPIAKVGNNKITVGEWQARVRLKRTQLINQAGQYLQYAQYFGIDVTRQLTQIQGQLNASTSLGETVLDNMIDEELIRQEAAKRGIKLDTNKVTQLVHSSFNYYPNGTPTPTITPTPVSFPTLSPDTLALVTITPTPTQLMTETPTPTSTPNPLLSPTPTSPPTATPTLTPTATAGPSPTATPTSTPYTLQGFQDQYQQSVTQVATETGLKEAQFHQLFADTVLRQQLKDVITADVPRVQDQVWARHILVKDEATAKAVRQRLINGEDFAKVAAEVSTDTGTKDKGGDLGWFGKGTMVPEFENAAFNLKVGEISQPIKSQYGYHIIQVLAHEKVPLDAQAYQQAKDTAFSDWLQNARKTYNVVTYDNWQSLVPIVPTLPPSLQVQPTP